MELKCIINGQAVAAEARADMTLLDFLRARGYRSVKCGCETTNCGLCTVWLDGKPVLSCAVPAMRVQGREVTTLEGLKEEAEEFGRFLGEQGAEQCGFCSPGFIMNVLAMRYGKPHVRKAPGDPGISGRQSVPLHGICRPDEGHPKLAGLQKTEGG